MTVLSRAFTDTARRLEAAESTWIEGEREPAVQPGAPFPCSLLPTNETERAGRAISTARLLYSAGAPDLGPADQVIIEAAGHALGRWLIDGRPTPHLRRRRVVAWEARVRRVEGAASGNRQ